MGRPLRVGFEGPGRRALLQAEHHAENYGRQSHSSLRMSGRHNDPQPDALAHNSSEFDAFADNFAGAHGYADAYSVVVFIFIREFVQLVFLVLLVFLEFKPEFERVFVFIKLPSVLKRARRAGCRYRGP